jgi:acyl carrier protein
MNLGQIDKEMETGTQRDDVIVQLREELFRIQPRLPENWPTGALFQADLGLDSLDLVELVARVEQRYGMLINDTDIPNFISLDVMADYICARMPT